MTEARQREHAIDVMRFIGLTMIFIAHSGPGNLLFQFRCFDVPMMLFISGLSYSDRDTGSYLGFVWKRATRLFVPLYSFLICYFLLKWVLSSAGLCTMTPVKTIAGTFALCQPSIGKVWIFRVFFIVMLLTPPLLALEKKLPRWAFWGVLSLMFAVQSFLIEWLHPLNLGRFVEDWCLYAVGYSIPFFLGCHARKSSTGNNIIAAAVLMVCFAAAAVFIVGRPWLIFQAVKYPPHAYYLLWGCLISILLWTSRRIWMPVLDWRFVNWIGRNTIWIYIWHTPFVCDVTQAYMKGCHWSLRFAVLAVAGIGLYAIQYTVVQAIARKYPDARILKYFAG